MSMKLRTADIKMPSGKEDAIFFDDQLGGFGLRLKRGSGGKIIRNWIVQYRIHGRQRRMVIGSGTVLTAAQARQKAKKLLAQVELGTDVQAEKRERHDRDAHTFRSIAQDFVASKDGTIKTRSVELLRWYLIEGPHMKPLLGIPISQVSRADIAARLLAASKASGVPTSIALRSAVSACFSWAMQMGLAEANPVVAAYKPKAPPSRDRVLSDGELSAIWNGLANDDYSVVVKLLILSGARRGEIAGIRWSEINLDKGVWTLPKERSKNGKAHMLPLTPMMRSIIDTVPQRDGYDILFGYRRGFTSWVQGKQALDAKVGLPAWHVHDIRRSVATRMADLGIAPHIIEQILNHQSGHKRGVAGIYNRSSYEREVRAAMALWSDHIASITTGGERKVVALNQREAG
jgi:integrase